MIRLNRLNNASIYLPIGRMLGGSEFNNCLLRRKSRKSSSTISRWLRRDALRLVALSR